MNTLQTPTTFSDSSNAPALHLQPSQHPACAQFWPLPTNLKLSIFKCWQPAKSRLLAWCFDLPAGVFATFSHCWQFGWLLLASLPQVAVAVTACKVAYRCAAILAWLTHGCGSTKDKYIYIYIVCACVCVFGVWHDSINLASQVSRHRQQAPNTRPVWSPTQKGSAKLTTSRIMQSCRGMCERIYIHSHIHRYKYSYICAVACDSWACKIYMRKLWALSNIQIGLSDFLTTHNNSRRI